MKSITLATAALLLLAAPALAHDGTLHEGCPAGQSFTAGELTVSGTFTRATLPNARSAGGFMLIENAGAAADRLVGASTDGAERSEVHEMKMEGDVMKMQELAGGLAIPANGSVSLQPGGLHVMMMGLRQPLRAGECLEMVLHFEQAGDLPVVLAVVKTEARTAPAAHESGEMPQAH